MLMVQYTGLGLAMASQEQVVYLTMTACNLEIRALESARSGKQFQFGVFVHQPQHRLLGGLHRSAPLQHLALSLLSAFPGVPLCNLSDMSRNCRLKSRCFTYDEFL